MACLKCVSFNSASVVPIQMEEFVVVQMHYLLSLWATRLSQRHCTIFILDLPLALLQMSRERSRSRSDGSLRPGDRDGLGPRATDPAAASSPCRWSRHARMQQVVVHSLLIERWTTLEEVKSQLSLAIMMGEKAAASLAQAGRAFKIAVGTQLEENISSNIGNLQTSMAEIDLHLAQVAEAVGDWAARHVSAGLSLPSLPEVDMEVAPPHPHA